MPNTPALVGGYYGILPEMKTLRKKIKSKIFKVLFRVQ